MKNKSIIITLIVTALVIIGIAVALIVTGNNKKEETKPEPTATPKPTAVAKEEVTITFDTDGGKEVKEIKVEKGKTATLPKTEKEGYQFAGWYDGETEVDEETTFSKDVTLKAKWTVLKEPQATSTPTPKPSNTPKATPTPTPTPSSTPKTPATPKPVTYSCPDGFDLDESTKKCTSKKNPEYVCPDGYGWSEKEQRCYRYSSAPTNITCKNGGTYIKREHASALCGYNEITRLMGNVSGCQNEGGQMYNNHCYKSVSLATDAILDYTCPGTSEYRTATDLGGTQNSGCYVFDAKKSSCKNAGEGYTMNYTINKCVKTIDATAK